MTRETVWWETRARRATSRIVAPFTRNPPGSSLETLRARLRKRALTMGKKWLCYRSHPVPGALKRHGEGGPDVGYLTPQGADRSRRPGRDRRGRTHSRGLSAQQNRWKRQSCRHDGPERVQRRRPQDARDRNKAEDRGRCKQPDDALRHVRRREPARRLPRPGGRRAAVHLAKDAEEPPALLC